MFGFVQWDNPLALALEALLSLAIVVGLIVVVRRVNAKAAADHRGADPGSTARDDTAAK